MNTISFCSKYKVVDMVQFFHVIYHWFDYFQLDRSTKSPSCQRRMGLPFIVLRPSGGISFMRENGRFSNTLKRLYLMFDSVYRLEFFSSSMPCFSVLSEQVAIFRISDHIRVSEMHMSVLIEA